MKVARISGRTHAQRLCGVRMIHSVDKFIWHILFWGHAHFEDFAHSLLIIPFAALRVLNKSRKLYTKHHSAHTDEACIGAVCYVGNEYVLYIINLSVVVCIPAH